MSTSLSFSDSLFKYCFPAFSSVTPVQTAQGNAHNMLWEYDHHLPVSTSFLGYLCSNSWRWHLCNYLDSKTLGLCVRDSQAPTTRLNARSKGELQEIGKSIEDKMQEERKDHGVEGSLMFIHSPSLLASSLCPPICSVTEFRFEQGRQQIVNERCFFLWTIAEERDEVYQGLWGCYG